VGRIRRSMGGRRNLHQYIKLVIRTALCILVACVLCVVRELYLFSLYSIVGLLKKQILE
jgi:hypothetical protein